ncbi:MAG: ABC transporter permease [Candidatus Riflebacteria bacterium HGW-Riflebacteria-2]|jgi:iron complex transport system permease protein|nr:MAG: ABC transporter permease [Candidatus Riflebacteria bacterium HGW-Riflebacteria-2]
MTKPAELNPVRRARILFIGLGVLLALVFVLSLLAGRYPSPGFLGIDQIQNDQMASNILFQMRLPRVLLALVVGMSLAAAGTVMQMIFGNPLVDPGFLGVSQGAAFGAGLSIVFLGNSPWLVQGSAAFFACLGLAVSYLVAWKIRYGSWVLRLILAGICVSAIFTSLLGIIKYSADPTSQLAELTFWLLGGLSAITWQEVYVVGPLVAVCLTGLMLFRWRLNVLALKDSTAFSLGASTSLERLFILALAVIATAAVTAVSGLVAWVGLIMPHLARRLFGADARFALPGSMLLGGLTVLICDSLSRVPFAAEIPLGIVTSLFGALFFMVLMMSGSVGVKK